MCLVSVAPKGTEKYNDKVIAFIKSGFSSNRDGSGFMYKRNGSKKVTVSKGYFADVDKLLEAIEKLKLGIDDELVIHHRIGTSGLVSKENCHPFVLSNKHSECCATEITIDKPCLVHNGFISKINMYMSLDKDFSDTYAFTRYVMSNKELLKIFDEDEMLFSELTDHMVGSSKIAILYPDQDLKTIGTFIQDEGYQHSNYGYKTYVNDRGGSSFLGGNSYYDRYAYLQDSFDEGFGGSEDWDTERKSIKQIRKDKLRKDMQEAIKSRVDNPLSITTTRHIVPTNMTFDNNCFPITKYNFNHFNFIEKATFEEQKKSGKFEVYTLDDFDPECDFQQLKIVSKDGQKTWTQYEAVLTDTVLKDYYYLPKLTYSISYAQYMDLCVKIVRPGKQCLKKLDKLLYVNLTATGDTEIYYPKVKLFYTKRALQLFRDLVEREIRFRVDKGLPDLESVEDITEEENSLKEIIPLLN